MIKSIGFWTKNVLFYLFLVIALLPHNSRNLKRTSVLVASHPTKVKRAIHQDVSGALLAADEG